MLIDPIMCERINKRLAELNQQFEQGSTKLIRMERERTELRETLFRIQGAILVLKEFSVRDDQQNSPNNLVEETAEVHMPASPDEQVFEDK